jgi:predicted esterase
VAPEKTTGPRLERHTFSARVDCHYIVQTPESLDDTATIFTLHGYGMDAATMLRLTTMWFPQNRIISMQAPHPFYRDPATREVGYSWATQTHADESVRLHHDMLLHVMDADSTPPERRLIVGFSQPVGLNYRFAASYPFEVRGVIGICGGLPGNWESGNYLPVDAALFHIARTDDEVYSADVTRHYEERLKLRARDVQFLELPGKHRFPSLAQPAVQDWMRRKFPA